MIYISVEQVATVRDRKCVGLHREIYITETRIELVYRQVV